MSHPKAADETHRRILQAALDCFSRKGYNSTTMDQIAAESGTSKGTLYWHFESKDDLLESAFRWFFKTLFGPEALAILEASPTAAGKLRILSESTVEFSQQAEGMFNLFLEFWASSTNREKSANLWLDLLVEYRDIVTGVIDEGVEQGEFRAVDAEALAWALTAAYDGLAAYVMLKPDLDLPRIHSAFIETLLHGLEVDT
jgi:AcrR family transcriptional regulator